MIKDNEIDLTEHRDFRGENNSPLFIRGRDGQIHTNPHSWVHRAINKELYGNIPWRFEPKCLEGYFSYDGLVALGNKQRRKETIQAFYWGSSENKICDCCGKEYNKIPWKLDYGLCKQCIVNNQPFSRKRIPWN